MKIELLKNGARARLPNGETIEARSGRDAHLSKLISKLVERGDIDDNEILDIERAGILAFKPAEFHKWVTLTQSRRDRS